MKLNWVTLRVSDLARSIAYYDGLLGLSVGARFSSHGSEIAMLGQKDGTKLELIADGKPLPEARGRGVTIGVGVSSLEASTALLEQNGYPKQAGPLSPAPGVRFSFFSDPDGYEVQLVEEA